MIKLREGNGNTFAINPAYVIRVYQNENILNVMLTDGTCYKLTFRGEGYAYSAIDAISTMGTEFFNGQDRCEQISRLD